MLKMIAFDFDGTLAPTIPMVIDVFRRSVAPYVEHELTKQAIVQTFGLNEVGMVKAVAGQRWPVALAAFYQEYARAHLRVSAPYPGIVTLLELLQQQGMALALITGKAAKSCQISLDVTGLTSYFPTRLYGSECRPNKADNLRQLMRTKSLDAAELLYVGDTRSDFEAADTAGGQCLTAAWDPNQPIVEASDQIVFTSLEQLWVYLQRRLGHGLVRPMSHKPR
mgnify:FL=1